MSFGRLRSIELPGARAPEPGLHHFGRERRREDGDRQDRVSDASPERKQGGISRWRGEAEDSTSRCSGGLKTSFLDRVFMGFSGTCTSNNHQAGIIAVYFDEGNWIRAEGLPPEAHPASRKAVTDLHTRSCNTLAMSPARATTSQSFGRTLDVIGRGGGWRSMIAASLIRSDAIQLSAVQLFGHFWQR